jgi:rhodanese-related sulfurtransferase
MTSDELARQLKAGSSPVVLDVRSEAEFKSGHIPGAIHAPLANILSAATAASSNKGDLLVVVCEHGPRAQLARMFLKFQGYKKLELLDGHMALWRQSGRFMKKG